MPPASKKKPGTSKPSLNLLNSKQAAAELAELDRLADEYLTLKEQANRLNSEAQTLYDQIGELADRRKIEKYRAPGYSMTRCRGRETLSKTRLIEEGVAADVIERCEVPGKPYYLIRRVEEPPAESTES